MEIGTANYDRKSNKNIEKIKDGDNVFRVLPPLGKLARDGKWFVYKKVEWGYKNSDGKNKPFQDPCEQNFKTKVYEVDTLARVKREELAAKFEQASKMYKAGQLTKDEMEKVTEIKKQFNLEKKYYVNAINQKGDIILLKIGYKAFKALEEVIKKLRAEGTDPLSIDNGRFFNISRSGDGFDTAFAVSVVTENIKIDGVGMVQKQIQHVLDESILSRLAKEATDLTELDKMYPKLTADQVNRIVKEGAKAVDELLGTGESQDQSGGEDEAAAAQSASTANVDSSKTAAEAPKQEVKTEVKVEVKAEPVVEAKVETPVSTPAAALTSAEDKAKFLASLGVN